MSVGLSPVQHHHKYLVYCSGRETWPRIARLGLPYVTVCTDCLPLDEEVARLTSGEWALWRVGPPPKCWPHDWLSVYARCLHGNAGQTPGGDFCASRNSHKNSTYSTREATSRRRRSVCDIRARHCSWMLRWPWPGCGHES